MTNFKIRFKQLKDFCYKQNMLFCYVFLIIIFAIITIGFPRLFGEYNWRFIGNYLLERWIDFYIPSILLIFILMLIFTWREFKRHLLVFATLLLFLIAIPQVYSIKVQSNADLLLRMFNNFLYANESNKIITKSIDDYFDDQKNVCLLDTTKRYTTKRNGAILKTPNTFEVTEWDLDRYLMPFDQIQILIESGIFNYDQIDRIFGWYITRAWKYWEIRRYIEDYRWEKDPYFYEKFEMLARKLIKKEDKNIQNGIKEIIQKDTNKNIDWVIFDNATSETIIHEKKEIKILWNVYNVIFDKRNIASYDEVQFERLRKADMIRSIKKALNY